MVTILCNGDVLHMCICSAKIKKLADEISQLTLLETLDLTDLLKDILGLSGRYVTTVIPGTARMAHVVCPVLGGPRP